MARSKLVIATRNSPLALAQALWVKNNILAGHPDLNIELLGLTTSADKMLHLSLAQFPGKGLFVKELEEALLDHRADLAVHSLKDVPLYLPEGLIMPVICQREDPRDVFISNTYAQPHALPQDIIIGTASMRRQSQLRALYPHLTVDVIRGNIQTRLKRLDQQDFGALIVAAAGMKRLGLEQRIKYYFPVHTILPSAGQGALAIECRSADPVTLKYIQHLHHADTAAAVNAERAFCQQLGVNCQVPVAAYARFTGQKLFLSGLVGKLDGSKLLVAHGASYRADAVTLGSQLAQILIAQGAKNILQNLSCN